MSRDLSADAALLAPGTGLREALDAVVAAGCGALVAIGDVDAVAALGDGGFEIGSAFSPRSLYELCKMDGAVTLDEGVGRILRANVHLAPDRELPTDETGIRHRTAQQLSRASSALVIAVSERRGTITLYRDGHRRVISG